MIRVLIADDEPKVRQLIRIMLERETFSTDIEIVGEAQNGRIALNMISVEQPDVLITDVRMPGYSGLDLIRQAKERNPDISFIIISGYELFEYAHEAIRYGVEDYLLKPIQKDELVCAMNRVILKNDTHTENVKIRHSYAQGQQQQLLTRLMKKQLDELNEDSAQDEYGCSFLNGQYFVCILKVDTFDIFENQLLENGLTEHIQQTIDKILGIYSEKMIYRIDHGLVCFLFGIDNENQYQDICKSLKLIIFSRKIRDNFANAHITIAIGQKSHMLEELAKEYELVERAIQNRLILGIDKIIIGKTQKDFLSMSDVFSPSLQGKLSSDIKQGAYKEALDIIERLGIHVVAIQGITGTLIYQIVDEIIELVMHAVKNEFSQDKQKEIKKRIKNCINLCSNVQEIFSRLSDMLLEVFEQRMVLKKQKNTKPIESAKQFVRTHYGQSITLEEVGGAVGLSPTYLSAVFKKETGISFSEYVTKVRVEAACELLVNTNDSILDIAETVGYNDVKYFTKVFKKVKELSPIAYRKLYY